CPPKAVPLSAAASPSLINSKKISSGMSEQCYIYVNFFLFFRLPVVPVFLNAAHGFRGDEGDPLGVGIAFRPFIVQYPIARDDKPGAIGAVCAMHEHGIARAGAL